MSPAEREYLDRHGATKHRHTSNLIDALMTAADLLPGEWCRCDVGGRCRRHCAVDAVVERNVLAGRDWRPRVERFVRLLRKAVRR